MTNEWNIGRPLRAVSVLATSGAELQPSPLSSGERSPDPEQQAQAWRDILQGGFGILVVLGIGVYALIKLLKAGKKS